MALLELSAVVEEAIVVPSEDVAEDNNSDDDWTGLTTVDIYELDVGVTVLAAVETDVLAIDEVPDEVVDG